MVGGWVAGQERFSVFVQGFFFGSADFLFGLEPVVEF
jgi:hypothetical protein